MNKSSKINLVGAHEKPAAPGLHKPIIEHLNHQSEINRNGAWVCRPCISAWNLFGVHFAWGNKARGGTRGRHCLKQGRPIRQRTSLKQNTWIANQGQLEYLLSTPVLHASVEPVRYPFGLRKKACGRIQQGLHIKWSGGPVAHKPFLSYLNWWPVSAAITNWDSPGCLSLYWGNHELELFMRIHIHTVKEALSQTKIAPFLSAVPGTWTIQISTTTILQPLSVKIRGKCLKSRKLDFRIWGNFWGNSVF